MADTPDERAIKKIVEKAKKAATDTHRRASQLELELVQFKSGDKSIEFNVDLTAETVWATQQDIANLFDRDRRTIGDHKNIFKDNEFRTKSSVCRKFRHTGSDGKDYDVQHYNLDVISIGWIPRQFPKGDTLPPVGDADIAVLYR